MQVHRFADIGSSLSDKQKAAVESLHLLLGDDHAKERERLKGAMRTTDHGDMKGKMDELGGGGGGAGMRGLSVGPDRKGVG